ncbi:MAG: DUF5009 domain-containing protein [Opitutaceae bacterium]|nr:DUF5009 domain-containing protein [Opitutaceae bacterium]
MTIVTNPISFPNPRLDSLDVFRGLTMFLMLFANDMNDPDLGHVANVPEWLRHMPAGRDGMTFVDLIFPAFLFSAGLSIPLAIERRIQTAKQTGSFRHIAMRSLWLIVIGLGMVNTYRFHPTAMLISPALWEFLFFLSVILIWQDSPAIPGAGASGPLIRRSIGAFVLLVLAIVFRGSDGGSPTWMRTSWWGILTAIGIAYFIGASAYVLLRKNLAGLVGLFALLTAINIGDRTGALQILDPLRNYFSAAGLIGGLPSILVAGIIAGTILFDCNAHSTISARIRQLLWMAAAIFAAGLLLRPPFGISKPAETPAWCLLSTAVCCVLFAFLFWLVDMKHISTWASFVRATGRQPLLAYFLPHLFYSLLAIFGITWLDSHLNSGLPGILRSLSIALLILGVTTLLTRFKVNLRL